MQAICRLFLVKMLWPVVLQFQLLLINLSKTHNKIYLQAKIPVKTSF